MIDRSICEKCWQEAGDRSLLLFNGMWYCRWETVGLGLVNEISAIPKSCKRLFEQAVALGSVSVNIDKDKYTKKS